MLEKESVGAKQEQVEGNVESHETPETPERSVEQVQKELGDTVKNFADLSRAIEKSFTSSMRLLTETYGGVDFKDKKTLGQQIEAMEKGENEARSRMYGLMKELEAHPDAPKNLPDFKNMNDKQIAESFGHAAY